jgi:predicted metal-binding membrane protein
MPVAVPAAIAGAWVIAIVADGAGTGLARQALASGGGSSPWHGSAISFFCPLHLGSLSGGGGGVRGAAGSVSVWLGLALFLLAWQAMIVAMMLPSSVPLVRLFAQASSRAPGRSRAMAGFLGGYALVWTLFGAVAFIGDALLHRALDASSGLRAHQSAIVAGVLVIAGVVQFTPLKDRCLTECRHPGAFLIRHYGRGARGGFRLGAGHGLFCLGCCWALMLVMFAAGVASLVWMGALTALMVYEKTARHGEQAVPIVGVAFLVWAAIVAIQPSWLPGLLAGGL